MTKKESALRKWLLRGQQRRQNKALGLPKKPKHRKRK